MGEFISGRLAKPFSRWTADTEQAFLLALRLSGQVRKAAAEIGRSVGSAYKRRQRDPGFAAAWDATLEAQQAEWIAAQREWLGPEDDLAGGGRLTPGQQRLDGWNARKRTVFLETLKREKDVRAACAAAGMSSTSAYNLRGRSPPFAKAWAKALECDVPSVKAAAVARAVEGWEEPIVHGGQVIGHRQRYSDGLLRDLLRHELLREGDAAGDAERRARWGRAAAPGRSVEPVRGARYAPLPRATREETDKEILKKLDAYERRLGMEKAEEDEATWGEWQRCWGAMGRQRPRPMTAQDMAGNDGTDILAHG